MSLCGRSGVMSGSLPGSGVREPVLVSAGGYWSLLCWLRLFGVSVVGGNRSSCVVGTGMACALWTGRRARRL